MAVATAMSVLNNLILKQGHDEHKECILNSSVARMVIDHFCIMFSHFDKYLFFALLQVCLDCLETSLS